jgi:hypothetical protein
VVEQDQHQEVEQWQEVEEQDQHQEVEQCVLGEEEELEKWEMVE